MLGSSAWQLCLYFELAKWSVLLTEFAPDLYTEKTIVKDDESSISGRKLIVDVTLYSLK